MKGDPRGRAIVVGAGIGGLATARVLADRFDQVTVIDRDQLDGPRRAVPQGAHFHAVLSLGQMHLETLFPGFIKDCVADGAHLIDMLADVRVGFHGHELLRTSTGINGLAASRSFLETRIRQRVRNLPNVTFVDGTDATGLVHLCAAVTGVHTAAGNGARRTLSADLVVAATGRNDTAGAWLDRLGYRRAPADTVQTDLGYASCHYRLPADVLDGGAVAIMVGARRDRPAGLVFVQQEDDRWVLSLYGYGSHQPPPGHEQFLKTAEAMAPPDLRRVLRDAVPVDAIRSHQVPSCIRRRYDLLRNHPQGFVALGDAVCALNPVYGAGMTVAIAQAVALGECWDQDGAVLPGVYYRRAARLLRLSWWFALCADYMLPEVQGRRTVATRAGALLVPRILRAAEHNPRAATAVTRLINHTATPREIAGLLGPVVLP